VTGGFTGGVRVELFGAVVFGLIGVPVLLGAVVPLAAVPPLTAAPPPFCALTLPAINANETASASVSFKIREFINCLSRDK
jgi:hypothetical protein